MPRCFFRPRGVIAGLLAVVMVLSGCGRRQQATSPGGEAVLHLGNLTEPTDLDPHVITSHQDNNIVMALFEGLAQYDSRTAEPVPAMAERWETSADGLTWTFHLRRNAKWSNGDPVTAHDFVFAFRRILNPAMAAEYASMLFVLQNARALNAGRETDFNRLGAQAPDNHTLVLTLEHPAPYLPSMTCHAAWYPLHRDSLSKHDATARRGTAWTRPGNLVGNGYFILEEWRPQQFIRVRRNPAYWDAANVKLQAAVFYPIDSEDAEERSFRSGQLHVTTTLPITKVGVYRAEKSPMLQSHVMLVTFMLRFHTEKPPLTDPRVRRALSLAIDRERFVKDVLRGGQLPAGHLTPPGTAGFTATARTAFDLPAARKLLAEAGFPEGRGFPKLSFLYNSTEANRVIAETLQQMWRSGLGIDIALDNQEARASSSAMRAGNYEIGRFAWGGDYLDPGTFLELMTSTSGNNMTRWKNATYDALFAEANRSADPRRRFEIFDQLERLIAEEAPIAPVYFYVKSHLMRPEVKGWHGNLLDMHPLKGVWIEPAAKETK
jgi:oligopeptide transport system substrate-binding protein